MFTGKIGCSFVGETEGLPLQKNNCQRICTLCLKVGEGDPGVNFINILRAAFLYKSVLSSFSLITVWL